MRIIISPAKKMHVDTDSLAPEGLPQFLSEARRLLSALRAMPGPALQALWNCNDAIAALNMERLRHMDLERDLTPAILSYEGIQYQYMAPRVFEGAYYTYVQEHLRILSGLYGVLRPLDAVTPYRLEMGIRLENPRGKDLYQFWGDTITEKLNQALRDQGDDIVINLASDEYFKSVKTPKLQGQLIKPVFLDEKNGKFKVISFYAKKARGLMSRYIIENRLTQPEQLKAFNSEGYFFDADASEKGELVFKRHEQ